VNAEDDERIKRFDDGSVKVLVSKIFPICSGFQRTVSGQLSSPLDNAVRLLRTHSS
jgi:hypothetical protein